MTLNFADIAIICVYFLIILYIGFVVSRKKETKGEEKEDFLLAGRKLTVPLFVASLVATWYGSILGVGEFVYTSGIVAWICFGLPYYVAAALFAVFIAGKIRLSNVSTIPEQIRRSYGKPAGILSSVIILFITVPAAYILMLGILIQLFTGWQLWFAVTTGALLSLIYLYSGGFRADIYTNAAQFALMYVGFAVLIIFSMTYYGSFDEVFFNLPENHTSLTGGNSWQFIFAWFIIAFQTFVDPSFHQRCSAAGTPATAKKGILISVLFWAVFDFMTLTAGLYSRAFLDIDNPLMAYPMLGEATLPPVWKGIFIVSLLATVMSTLDSYAFISAATIGNDILSNFRRFKQTSAEKLTRIGLIVTGILGVVIAIAIPSAVEIIYKTASIAVPGLIFPLTVSMSRKYFLSSVKAVIIMAVSSSASLVWTIGKESGGAFFADIEPMFPGIVIAALLSVFFVKKVNK